MKPPIRILHIAHGIPSYHNSLLELARRLCESGEVTLTVASHEDLSSVLQRTDVPFVALEGDQLLQQQRDQAMARTDQTPRWLAALKRIGIARDYRKRSIRSTEIANLLKQQQPDLLLIDMECHKAIVQTHQSGLPTVLLSRWFTVFDVGNVPPLHTRQLPATNPIQAIEIRWQWLALRVMKFRMEWRHRLSRLILAPVTYHAKTRLDLGAVARAAGFSLSSMTQRNHWLIPHVYRHLPVMSLTAKAMDFGNRHDPRLHHVGAMVGKRNAPSPKLARGLEAVDRFLAQRRSANNPLIYCSYSTYWQTDEHWIQPILALFEQRQDLDLIIGLGARSGADSLPQGVDNMLVLDYAPQIEVLRAADIVITHGGISTINEALSFGVPLVVCSSGHVDQHGCAARVQHHSLGISCDTTPLDAREVETAIDQILGDTGQQIRQNARDMQRTLRRYDQENSAVRFLLAQRASGIPVSSI